MSPRASPAPFPLSRLKIGRSPFWPNARHGRNASRRNIGKRLSASRWDNAGAGWLAPQQRIGRSATPLEWKSRELLSTNHAAQSSRRMVLWLQQLKQVGQERYFARGTIKVENSSGDRRRQCLDRRSSPCLATVSIFFPALAFRLNTCGAWLIPVPSWLQRQF